MTLANKTLTAAGAIDGAGSNRFDSPQFMEDLYDAVVAIEGGVIPGVLDVAGNFTVGTNKFTVTAAAGNTTIKGALDHDGTTVGFYGTAPIAKQTGVAVDAAGIHAALVALGLIAA